MKIVDDKGDRCGIGKDGEIFCLPQIPIIGYYGIPEAVDSDGWFHTGDIGHFDEDGFLFVIDRKADMLNYRGHQISPSAVEAAILKHPGLVAACVVGIPDAICTELPATVVLKYEAANVTEQEINDIVKSTDSLRCGGKII